MQAQNKIFKIELPKVNEKIPASRQSPKRMIICSPPKIGKTTALSQLENSLILELDPGGADSVDCVKIDVENLSHLDAICDAIIKANKPYKYIVVDTVTMLEVWAEQEALRMYKNHPIGKNFVGDSVLILEHGSGYNWLRAAIDKYFKKLESLAERIIYVAHIRDKEITNAAAGVAVSAKEIHLTGKIRDIACAKSDAIGFIRRKSDGKNYLSFKPKSSEMLVCSARAQHLSDKEFVISEFVDGKLVTYWDKIFID